MQWFIVEAANKPGEFARHASAIANRGVNLSNVISLGIGDRGGAAFYATDEAGVRSALNEAGTAFREVSVVEVTLDDKPGTVADAAKRLGDAGVNIELIAPTGMDGQKVTIAFGVDKLEAARAALGDLVSTENARPQAPPPADDARSERQAVPRRVLPARGAVDLCLGRRTSRQRPAQDAVEVVGPAERVAGPAAAAVHDPVSGLVQARDGDVTWQLGPTCPQHPFPGGAVGPVLSLGALAPPSPSVVPDRRAREHAGNLPDLVVRGRHALHVGRSLALASR